MWPHDTCEDWKFTCSQVSVNGRTEQQYGYDSFGHLNAFSSRGEAYHGYEYNGLGCRTSSVGIKAGAWDKVIGYTVDDTDEYGYECIEELHAAHGRNGGLWKLFG